MSSNRPMLGCKQRAGSVGRYRIVQLEQSCRNFYPSGTFKAGSEAVRRIPLTRGKFALVDAEDYYQLSKFNWQALTNATIFYACGKVDGKTIKMHRFIMNAPSHLVVDHIDRNGLNNCKSNLRLCTVAQNSRNSGSNKGSTSRYKGVSWNRNVKKWGAQIRLNYKIHRIGYFENETEAAKAYDKRAVELHGEFACLNFPNEF